jgi:hypothetical protein
MEIARLLLGFLTFIFLVLIMIQHLKMMKETNRHILHIHQLLDALYMGINDPVARGYYASLRKEGPSDEISKEKKERMLDSALAREHGRVKEEIMKQIKESSDLEEIARMEQSLKEIDNIFTLIRTIGSDSSKEYQEQVQKEIEASKKRIFGID